ncbi:MAG: SHOCT domain-containing protein [Knoellia sp.]
MDWGDMGSGSGAMVFAWVLGLLLLVGLIVLVVTVLIPGDRTRPMEPPSTDGRSAAESELELRYARGEIDAATFVEARSILRQR